MDSKVDSMMDSIHRRTVHAPGTPRGGRHRAVAYLEASWATSARA
jgi:hypothetical protein